MLNRRREMGGGTDYSKMYLTFEAIEQGTFTLTVHEEVGVNKVTSVSYSIDDGNTWVTTNNADNTEVVITTPTVNAGGRVLWKGVASAYAINSTKYSCFSSTGKFNIYGNILSLLYNNDFVGIDSLASNNSWCFCYLFKGSKVVDAKNLMLRAMTLQNYCYMALFYGCSELMFAPILPAKTMVLQCYYAMFHSCSKLEEAPKLPATIIARACYRAMFSYCSSLKKAPELHAKTLDIQSYYNMFARCKKIDSITCTATDISADSCLTSWLVGVSSTGTFIKDADTTWPTGASGIPEGWTVENI